MAVNINEKLKQLRRDNDYTQEQIADIFHVSPQAVSRWETGASYPDIEILPHMAIFFDTTVDELLGTMDIKAEQRVMEYIRDARNFLNSGKVKEAVDTARAAVKEYPINYDLQNMLLETLCVENSASTSQSNTECELQRKEIMDIGERIINHSKNINLVSDTKFILIKYYSKWGKKDEGKKIVSTMPSCAYDTQELVLKYVLDGEDLISDTRHRIVRYAIILSDFIGLYAQKADISLQEKIECIKATKAVEEMPSNLKISSWLDTTSRALTNIHIAELYCETGDSINAMRYTTAAVDDALLHVAQMYETNDVGGNYLAQTTPRNLCWILWEDWLMKPQFDLVRDDAVFIQCFDKLKSNSKNMA